MMGLTKERRLNVEMLSLRNGQNHHSNHDLWVNALSEDNRNEGGLFLVNVGQNIELAKGAAIRGRVDEGVGLLRSMLRKIERFFGTPVNVVYHDALQELSELLESKMCQMEQGASGAHPSIEQEQERAQVLTRLAEIREQLALK